MAGVKQLIDQFNPDSYKLELDLNKQNKTFSGNLKISGYRRSRPSYRITLNQNGLKISNAKLFRIEKGQKKEIPISRLVHHNKLQELRIHTDQQITSGKYEIELNYSGKVSTKGTNGIYLSTWNDHLGESNQIIATQFQPHHARELLPCIDEPQAKAIFKLTLELSNKDPNDKILFNTVPLSIKELSSNAELIEFEHTPVMSTYLLALVIGDMQKKTTLSKNGTAISVYSTPDKIDNTAFALDFSAKVLDFLESKFQTKYPLNKLDLVGIPDYESSAAMENWGLITFREDYLLFDEDISTLIDKQAIAQVIAHEIAHQWFGNLVTMKWWDELWLNEGFANFMEYYVVDSIFPEWKMFEGYLVNEKSYAIRVDSLPSSRPIIKKVTSSHHAVEAFDGIAYEKSGNIVRMLFSILGETNFMHGLNNYFAQFAYKSATSNQLIGCWQKYTKLNLTNFVQSWLNEPGLPKLDVSIGSNPKQVVLEQTRFLSDKSSNQSLVTLQKQILKSKPNVKRRQREFHKNYIANQYKKKNNPTWHIPINFVYGKQLYDKEIAHVDSFIMTRPRHIVQLSSGAELPIKLNKDGSAFYLASYSTEFLAGISLAISSNKLGDLDTLGLLTDIISLNRALQFEPGGAAILEIIKSARNTVSSQFWTLTGGFIGYLHYHLKQTSQEKIIQPYIWNLISKKIKAIGFKAGKSDSPETIITRFELLSIAVLARHPECIQNLTSLYAKALKTGINSLESEKRLLALYTVAKGGKKSDYKQLLELYKQNLTDPNLKEDLAYALCLFEDEKSVKNNLLLMQDAELVRSQDIVSWLSQISSAGQRATNICLEWVLKQDGWAWLEENLSLQDLSTALKVVMSTSFTSKDLNKLKRYFIRLENIELEKALNEALDIAKSRIKWHKKELPGIISYLCSIDDNHVN